MLRASTIQAGVDFFEIQADCNLFRAVSNHMTVELLEKRHEQPKGSLTPRDLERATAIFAHRDLMVVGMIVVAYYEVEKLAKLNRLWVHPTSRQSGVGRSLMKLAEQRVVEMGGQTIEFETTLDLKPAVALYRKLGYCEEARCQVRPSGLLFRKALSHST